MLQSYLEKQYKLPLLNPQIEIQAQTSSCIFKPSGLNFENEKWNTINQDINISSIRNNSKSLLKRP